MLRFAFALFALVPFSFSQNLPAIRWVHQVDNTGMDTFAGIGTDAEGNSYIAGNTLSSDFPVKSAIQDHLSSSGLFRIDGSGSGFTRLGLTSATSIAVDPKDPNTLFAISAGKVVKSTDGGATFSTLMLPGSSAWMVSINPANDQILYVTTYDQGVFRSDDGGANWTTKNNGVGARPGQTVSTNGLWIDPATPNVVFAETLGNFLRSTDGGDTWQILASNTNVSNVYFDTATPGLLYAPYTASTTAFEYGGFKSTDHGQTLTKFATPQVFQSIVSDPKHAKRLLGAAPYSLYESRDDGSSWTVTNLLANLVVPDWSNDVLYVTTSNHVLRVSSDLQTISTVGPAALGYIQGVTVVNGTVYVAVSGTHDVFVTKLDPSGNVVYSTYFGGSAEDNATAMAVDASGNVYVTGTTTSLDFPVSKGAYAATGGSFLFRLNPDGSLGYSTYYAATGTTPNSIAVDPSGSAYIAGYTSGGLPVTPGAYQASCNCDTVPAFFMTLFPQSGFLARFDSTASSLIFSTYVGPSIALQTPISSIALGLDGSAYVAGSTGVHHLNSTGTSQLALLQSAINASAMTVGQDGSVYLAGSPMNNQFQPTAGSFQSTIVGPPVLPSQSPVYPGAAIVKTDAQLATVQAATFFGGWYGNQIKAIALDSEGNVLVAGATAPRGLPTRTPLQGGFGPGAGFLSELSSDLSTLLFSSYLGDSEVFSVQGVAPGSDGSVMIAGSTGQAYSSSGPVNIYANSITLTPPPRLRIDAVRNAASLLDGSISAGETIVVTGSGFGREPQLLIADSVAPAISVSDTTITAVVPQSVSGGGAVVQVKSGGATSNPVVVAVSTASPGIFSADGSGYGQGYILNKDGTLNTPLNPAAPGDPITIFATGVGPVSFTNGYAVTGSPVNVFIDGFFSNGIAAIMGPVSGLPGSVYQISVYVPDPAKLVANNPNLANFKFPPLVGVVLQVAGTTSQNGLAISISQ